MTEEERTDAETLLEGLRRGREALELQRKLHAEELELAADVETIFRAWPVIAFLFVTYSALVYYAGLWVGRAF